MLVGFVFYTCVWSFMYFIIILLHVSHGLDVKPQKEKYLPDYKYYHNFTQIQKEIYDLSKKYSDWIKLNTKYQSRYKRSQFLIQISDFNNRFHKDLNREKVKILFSYGEHAREFLPVESMLFLVRNITSGLSSSLYQEDSFEWKFSKKILSNIDLYVIAVANPDGRKYVEQSHNYCWRGTATGVDLERNFDWEFGGKGSSSNKADEEYRGKHPFSEPETYIFTDVTEIIQFDMFISFHSGINQIYIPYADSKSQKTHRKPDNLEAMEELALYLCKATKFKYKYGNAFQLTKYTADGAVFDYMAGVKKIPFSYTIELWGMDHKGPSCFDLFNPPSEKLQDVLEEIHPLYESLFSYLIDWKANHPLPKEEATSGTLGYFVILLVVIACIFAINQSRKFNRLYTRKRIVSLKSLSSTFSLSMNKKI